MRFSGIASHMAVSRSRSIVGAPKYKQPPINAELQQSMAQAQQQDIEAARVASTSEQQSLTARYGQLTGGDSASLLARYGTKLAFAGAGTSRSPLVL